MSHPKKRVTHLKGDLAMGEKSDVRQTASREKEPESTYFGEGNASECKFLGTDQLAVSKHHDEKSLFTLSNCLQIKASKLGGMHRQKRVTQDSLL